MPDMSGFEALLTQYGLPLVFVGCFLEGDAAAVVSGGLAHSGTLPLWGVLGLVFLGAFLADTMWFVLGRRLPHSPRFARHLESRVGRSARDLVARNPVLVILGFRFVWGTRIAVPLTLGASMLPARLVLSLDALACMVWAGTLVAVGYGIGATLLNLLDLGFHAHFGLVLAGGIAVALILGWIGRRVLRKDRAGRGTG
ncbi:DedA family protein [Sulfitobacter sp. D35]|uniref:DedA family protein n=1 Tax=Sulfitobacter sp. D35 TaxID=3083252 RepID=UPI00296EA47C|nr:DedA family protein [Sulfitobacter sp. D35]MDW4497450.1 DedA family protein [Sulfitobacter sp. D35]